MIKQEEWDKVAQVKKEEFGYCEVCGEHLEPKELCAKHLDYGEEVDENKMLLCCHDCNYSLFLAEQFVKTEVKHLAEETRKEFGHHQSPEGPLRLRIISGTSKEDLTRILIRYQNKRCEIIADGIIRAVGLHKTNKRPVIDYFLAHCTDNIDNDLYELCRKNGYSANQMYQRIAKGKLEILRKEEKAKKKHHKK